MAKTPTSKPPRAQRAAPAAPAAMQPAGDITPPASEPAADGALVDGDTIRMLTSQEGPNLSRVRNQLLVVGTDLGAAEATRLVDVDFAERA